MTYVFSSYGALSLETHQVGTVPGPIPRRGVTQATGVPRAPFRGEARRLTRKKATGCKRTACIVPTKLLTVLQLNAEGVSKKKIPLAKRLHKEDIDIVCIQESHLNDNFPFTIRG